jgi:hypothetical protein
MSMHRARRTGLIVCAIALLAAGCTSSGGGGDGVSPAPTGIGNGHTGGKHGGKHHHPPGHGKPGNGHHHKGGGSSSSAPSNGATHSGTPAPGHTSTSPAAHPSTKSGQPHSSTSSAPQPSLPSVVVTPHNGLGNVQTVTVEGFHFKPNTLLAVAECRDRGQDTNLPDCNINNVITYAPGKKVRSDANGHVGPIQITVRKTFKEIDCGGVKCLVAISEPALRPDPADEGDQYIHFA